MTFLSEILKSLSSERGGLYYAVSGGGGYFQNVTRILEFSDSVILLGGKRCHIQVEGEALSIGKYCGGDVTILGKIRKVEIAEG